MKYVIGMVIVLLTIVPALAIDVSDYGTVTLSKEKEVPTPFCPTTKISDNNKCMSCHAMVPGEDGKPKWGLKELSSDAGYYMMPSCLDIITGPDGKKFFRMDVTGTNATSFRRAVDYMYRHPEFKHLSVHLHTPGGSVMDAWKAVGIIREAQSRGIKVSTHVYGISASAGVILMVAGDIGERYVNPNAEIMMHKVWSFSMFDLSDPDTAEDKAATLKHFQDNINNWFVSRTKMSHDEIEKLIFKKDFWMDGRRAVELGIADQLVE